MSGERNGFFICIEGIDGSGKTTQARRLVKTLVGEGYDAVYTTEPTEGAIGKIIRKQILQGTARFPVLEAVLFAADRVHHLENEVVPLLKAGKVVVCDRYVYSSVAYQGASGLPIKWIEGINKYAIVPDIAIYIDVPPEVVFRRIRRKKTVMETLETQQKVRGVYLKLLDEKKLVAIDGKPSPNMVAQAIETMVLEFLRKK